MVELNRMRQAVGFFALSLGLGACSSSNASSADDAGGADNGGAVGCAKDPRVETMMVNLTHEGDNLKKKMPGLSFVITKADFIPPAAENNTWTLKILDANGQPTKGAVVTFPILEGRPSDPWMPDHSHPAAHAAATPNADGTFTVCVGG
jgi:hypothetical protein